MFVRDYENSMILGDMPKEGKDRVYLSGGKIFLIAAFEKGFTEIALEASERGLSLICSKPLTKEQREEMKLAKASRG